MQAQRELERFAADALYCDRHRRELLQQYADRWVAIYDERVVGAADDLKDLLKQLQRKGLDPAHIYHEYLHEYLTGKEELLILASAGR